MDTIYEYTSDHTGETNYYCEDCADAEWLADAQRALEHNSSARGAKRDISDLDLPEDTEAEDYRDEICCADCGWKLRGAFVRCACGAEDYEGEDSDFDEALGDGYWQWDEDGGKRLEWCESCRYSNHPLEKGDVLVNDDGRAYRLSFIESFTGAVAIDDDDRYGPHYATQVDVPVYAAGCRRFPMAIALQHWGSPGHYSNRRAAEVSAQYPDDPPLRSAADLLFRAVLAHAMRRALPRLNNRLVDVDETADI